MMRYMHVYHLVKKMSRKYHIINGSKAFFNNNVPREDDYYEIKSFMELVQLSDQRRNNKIPFDEDDKAEVLIVKNEYYHGITEQAHDRLGGLIEELTLEDAEIYVHNPPIVLKEYIDQLNSQGRIECDKKCEEYQITRDAVNFVTNMKKIGKQIIGQNTAIEEISKSMWYLTKAERKKPYVIMLYGNSSLGKTELVREISKCFFEGKWLEKHLSMFKNDRYSDYFFGERPNRKSLGYDLLERESNIIFLDEIDKCPEYFYSAFYTLFDNTIFMDASYEVDISGTIIILTSNFSSKDEMKKNLGLPIYYRIDKFIHFEDFMSDSIYKITMNEINMRKKEYQAEYSPEEVYAEVSPLINIKGENARTIKYKVQKVIENMLFRNISKAFSDHEY